MNISKDGIEFIKAREGFRAVPYNDTAGNPTIGFGHKVLKGEHFGSIGSLEATSLLLKDLDFPISVINNAVEVHLEQYQFDALCSFVYNAGAHAFGTSTLLKALNEEKYGEAANEILKWCYETKNGTKSRNEGLYRRRVAERELFLTGKYTT